MKAGIEKNQRILLLLSVLAVIMILCIGPMDVFTHGNFCDAVNVSDIEPDDFLGEIDLGKGAYTGWFVPLKKYFRGFELNLCNAGQGREGSIVVSVLDKDGRILDTAVAALSQMPQQQWYWVYLHAALAQGEKYYYTIAAEDCLEAPCLQVVDTDYLGYENKEDGVLIGYMYAEPVFTFSEKVLFGIFILAVWLLLAAQLCLKNEKKAAAELAAVTLLMIFGMTWNYMFNSLDGSNTGFAGFQADSETLVTGVVYAEQQGLPIPAYGLGRYFDLRGTHMSHMMSFRQDDDWIYGYSKKRPAIVVPYDAGLQSAGAAGNYIRFANGDVLRILGSWQSDAGLCISLDADGPLNYYKYGDLAGAQFLDASMQPIVTSRFTAYASQYGLQGKVFRHLARHIEPENVLQYLNFLCSFAAAVVFALLILLIYKKYNFQLAACFFVVFLLSPWVVNFARNLYWVEFTWFLPMLAGLFCAVFIEKKWCRILSCITVFVSITGKCLCGYEYISTIMMGAVLFLLADLCRAVLNKEKEKGFLIFWTTAVMGASALCGFLAAVCIHAKLRGSGNVLEGIKSIILYDVLRRTLGGDMNVFDAGLWASFQSSSWDVLSRYFHFSTEVIAGVTGNLFPLLCIVPLIIFGYNYKKKCIDWNDVVLYVLCFAVSISWYVLGKQHSYVHTHMNYVLWYFGYVQVCFYVICRQITNFARNRGRSGKDESGSS